MSVFQGEVRERATAIVAEYPHPRSAVLPLLHLLQEAAGYCTEDGMREIAHLLDMSPAEVLGTASFYTMFKREPVGRHLVSVCTTTACQIVGGDKVFARLCDHYGVRNRETTADGEFTVEEVECAAACGHGPVMQVDYRFFERVTPESAVEILDEIRADGLEAVHARRGSVTAPLPPLDPDEVAAGPAPVTASPRPGGGGDGDGERSGP